MPNNNTISSYYSNKNIVLHELIGLKVKVRKSKDPNREGTTGTVLSETKNTLLVETNGGRKAVPKSGSEFLFSVGNKSFIVEGREILFRPHERIKKGIKFYKKRD
jgi:RNase P/RNase MRP subunit p29